MVPEGAREGDREGEAALPSFCCLVIAARHTMCHVPRHNKKQVLKRYCSALGVRDTCVICMGLFILVEQHVRAVSRQNTMPFPFV